MLLSSLTEYGRAVAHYTPFSTITRSFALLSSSPRLPLPARRKPVSTAPLWVIRLVASCRRACLASLTLALSTRAANPIPSQSLSPSTCCTSSDSTLLSTTVEIVRILKRKFGYHTNYHTVKRFLARYPIPFQLPLSWTLFHDFEDAYQARWNVVRLYYEGWHQQSIAGCLRLSRQHVRTILDAFQRDGFAGLEDQRTRPPLHPANQLTLPLLKELLDIQREYPRAGRFRVRGLLEERRKQRRQGGTERTQGARGEGREKRTSNEGRGRDRRRKGDRDNRDNRDSDDRIGNGENPTINMGDMGSTAGNTDGNTDQPNEPHQLPPSSLPSLATIGRGMAINRQLHGAPGPWVSAKEQTPGEEEPKEMLYQPTRRHQYWYIDLRYLVRLADPTDLAGPANPAKQGGSAERAEQESHNKAPTEGKQGRQGQREKRRRRKQRQKGHWTYSVCILEGYSRKILAGMVTEHQDSMAVLQILHSAIEAYGAPEGIVSDNGSIFTGRHYIQVLEALGITPCYIERGKPWQNLIEAQFKVQLRLADAKFEQSTTLQEVQERHSEFVLTFNETLHWAHRDRPDGLRCPVEVLHWVRGRPIETGELDRIFKSLKLERVVTQYGFVRVQRFYLYAERGLARKRVAIWVYEQKVEIGYEEALLAEYEGRYDRHQRQLQQVWQLKLYHHTQYASPQLELWELDEEQWHKIREVPLMSLGRGRGQRQRAASMGVVEQLHLQLPA